MKITFCSKFLFCVTLLGLSLNALGQAKFKVALDAGHGDHDFGAVYNGHIEKKIALGVVLKVGKILEKNPNIDVIYTRKTDQFIDLIERANIANRADANIFVSIHCNANKNISVSPVSYISTFNQINKLICFSGINNINVIYTRKTDQFIDLIERANIANRADANIFVSIHCNANKNQTADGCETYVMGMSKNASNLEAAKKENEVITMEKDYKQKYEGYDPKSPETMIGLTMMQEEYLENSIALAGSIQNHFMDELGKKSRGVKQAPFMVLHKAYMPRVLVEMGFISNPVEGEKLDSEEGQQEIAQSIANAIIAYKKEYFGAANGDEIVKPSQKIEKTDSIKVVDTPDTAKVVTKTPEIKKPEIKKQEPKAEVQSEKEVSTGTVFKVQLSASGKKLELVPSNFKGLSNISMISEGSLYKYTYGETSNYDEAKRLLSEAKSKGYSSAFIIAYKDGRKMSVQEALKQ